MKLTVKALAIVSIASIILPQTAASSFAEDTPVSGPYYQLISPATKYRAARYRYYENGDNPNYFNLSADGSKQNSKRVKRCLFISCSRAGRLGDKIFSSVSDSIWGRI